MKANELMIGDWLYSIIDRYDHIEKKPVKITGIRTEDDELLQGNDSDVWYHIETYEPIPLTKEILEKNGFTTYGETWYLPNKNVSVSFLMYDTIINVKRGDDYFFKKVPCAYRDCAENRHVYVHQLQHALRLCGIEKEIEP